MAALCVFYSAYWAVMAVEMALETVHGYTEPDWLSLLFSGMSALPSGLIAGVVAMQDRATAMDGFDHRSGHRASGRVEGTLGTAAAAQLSSDLAPSI